VVDIFLDALSIQKMLDVYRRVFGGEKLGPPSYIHGSLYAQTLKDINTLAHFQES